MTDHRSRPHVDHEVSNFSIVPMAQKAFRENWISCRASLSSTRPSFYNSSLERLPQRSGGCGWARTRTGFLRYQKGRSGCLRGTNPIDGGGGGAGRKPPQHSVNVLTALGNRTILAQGHRDGGRCGDQTLTQQTRAKRV
jgi:hypothetical protein